MTKTYKDIAIDITTRKRLQEYKIKWERNSYDSVINAALDGYEDSHE